MARPSIARRLAIGLSVGMALVWLAAVAIAGSVMQHEVNDVLDDTLRQAGFRLLPLAIHDLTEPERDDLGERFEQEPVGVLREDDEFFTYYIRDRDGGVLVRAEDLPEEIVSANVPDGLSEVDGRRVFALTDTRTGYGIVVVEHTDHRPRVVADSIAALAWPLIGLGPLIGIGILYTTRTAMRPVRRLSNDIARRDRRNLSPLSVGKQPTELAPIADAVESLLARLRAALDAERVFAASSAHELRTPIAGALAQTQQLALELGDSPSAPRIREIESALKRLSQLSERLLQLSRLEAGFARSETRVDLIPALRLVVHDFNSAASGSRIRLHEDEGAALNVAINLDAFAVALRNLIQNALNHGAPDQPVDVHAGPGARIRVVNRGKTIPPDGIAHLSDPFIRGDTAAEGSGLGLSIVRSIVDQTNGSLTLRSPAPSLGEGFEAEITWADDHSPTGRVSS